MDPFDPKQLRYRPSVAEPKNPPINQGPPHHCRGEKFLKGPVPLGWLAAAGCLPGKSLQVGVVLWFLAGLKKNRTIALPNKLLELFGVSRNAKYRAVRWLEDADLITVEHRSSRNPTITLLRARE